MSCNKCDRYYAGSNYVDKEKNKDDFMKETFKGDYEIILETMGKDTTKHPEYTVKAHHILELMLYCYADTGRKMQHASLLLYWDGRNKANNEEVILHTGEAD